jgi:hypothetical protein
VSIPPFENRSDVLEVAEVLTREVRNEFIGRGNYRLEAEAAAADAVLQGEVLAVSYVPVAFDDQQLGTRYLFTITMRIAFVENRTGDPLWSNDALTFREEYEQRAASGAGDAGVALLDQESGSMDRIASDVARSVVTSILEAF